MFARLPVWAKIGLPVGAFMLGFAITDKDQILGWLAPASASVSIAEEAPVAAESDTPQISPLAVETPEAQPESQGSKELRELNAAIYASVAAAVEKPPITFAPGDVLVPASGFGQGLARLGTKLRLDRTFVNWITCSACGSGDLDVVNRDLDDGDDLVSVGESSGEGRPLVAGSNGLRIVFGALAAPASLEYQLGIGEQDERASAVSGRLESVPAAVVLRVLEDIAAVAGKNHTEMWIETKDGFVRVSEHGLVTFYTEDVLPNACTPRDGNVLFSANTVYVLTDGKAKE